MIIIDTSAWIPGLRDRDSIERAEIDRLLGEGEVAMVGPVLVELLRGARSDEDFRLLADSLAGLPFIEADHAVWMRAGQLSLTLRRQGGTVGLVDVLIAALAIEGGHRIYAKDSDFHRVPNLQLHSPAPA